MAQMSSGGPDELTERARRAAEAGGRRMNDDVAANLAGEASALREKLARAGLLAAGGPARTRPDAQELARARAAAGGGTPLSTLVEQGR